MPSISKSTLRTQLLDHVEGALRAADSNGDGAVSAADRARLPEDVRGPADSTADYYLQGGAMGIEDYLGAYGEFASKALDDADSNGNGTLTVTEQDALPPIVYKSVLAMRTAPATAPTAPPVAPPAAPPAAPANPPANNPAAGAGALGIAGVLRAADVTLRTVVGSSLSSPTAIAFDPRTSKLWITNKGDDSTVVVSNPTSQNPTKQKFSDDSDHFMNNPMGLAFSPMYDEMATVQDSNNDYNGQAAGNLFMGPTLWPSDAAFNGKASCHVDMLHHSPVSVGITAGTQYPAQREYWVFNGEKGSIDRYFFHELHVPGGHDHSDGLTLRYGAGALKRGDECPSHLALDSASGWLYVADTGHGRIVKIDTKVSIDNPTQIIGHHDETPLYRIDGATPKAVTGAGAGLVSPSGLVLHEGKLVVSDYATGHIKVFAKDGTLEGDLDTGLGANALAGLAVGPNGKLFVADQKNDRVLEITVD